MIESSLWNCFENWTSWNWEWNCSLNEYQVWFDFNFVKKKTSKRKYILKEFIFNEMMFLGIIRSLQQYQQIVLRTCEKLWKHVGMNNLRIVLYPWFFIKYLFNRLWLFFCDPFQNVWVFSVNTLLKTFETICQMLTQSKHSTFGQHTFVPKKWSTLGDIVPHWTFFYSQFLNTLFFLSIKNK